ncbi:MAG: hypothetical protein ABIJ09_26355 [Pseudomonadota bacterium]
MSWRNHPLRWPALCALVTALWQSLVIFVLSAPSGVFTKYLVLAGQVHAGTAAPNVILDVSPLYLWLHVAARHLSSDPVGLVQGIQVGLLALACGMLAAAVTRDAGPRWAALTTVLFNLSPGVLVYGRVLEPEALLLCLVSGFIALGGQPSWRARLAAGLFLGAALWTRLTLLPVLLLLPLVVFLQHADKKRRQHDMLALLGPPLLALLLLWVRNAVLAGSLLTTVMNPGTVSFEGNNPLSTGQSAAYPPLVNALIVDLPPQPDSQHQAYRLVARRESTEELDRNQVNALWQSRARSYAADHPALALRRLGMKLWLALQQGRRHDLVLAAVHDDDLARKGLLWLPWAGVTALAVLGLVALWRRRSQGLLLHAVWAVQLAGMLLTYVSERQKLATVPVVLLLAVTTCQALWSTRRRWTLVLAAPLMLVLAWPSARVLDEQAVLLAEASSLDRFPAYEQAVAQGAEAEIRQQAAAIAAQAPWQLDGLRPVEVEWDSRQLARHALAIASREHDADTPSRALNRAQLGLAAGEFTRAEHELQALVDAGQLFSRGALQSSDPRWYLARCLALDGKRAQALAVLRAATKDNPGEPWILAELVALEGDGEFAARIERYFGALDAAWLVGSALLVHGQHQRAAVVLEALVQQLPEFRSGLLLLSEARAHLGDDEAAVPLLLQALLRRPQPLPDESWALPLMERWAARGQNPAQRAYLRGVVLRMLGRLDEARRVQQAAQDSSGDPEAVKRELDAIDAALVRRGEVHEAPH